MFTPKELSGRWMLLIAGDFAAAALASYGACAMDGTLDLAFPSVYQCHETALVLSAAAIGAIYFQDLYKIDVPRSLSATIAGMIRASAKVLVVFAALASVAPAPFPEVRFAAAYFALSTTLLIGWRIAAAQLFIKQLAIGVMALGITEYGPILVREVEKREHLGYHFLGFASSQQNSARAGAIAERLNPGFQLFPASSMADVVSRYAARIVVMLDPRVRLEEVVRCRLEGVEVLEFETFFERLTGKLPVQHMRQEWALLAPGYAGRVSQRLLKRAIDLSGGALLGLLSLPVAILAAGAIKLDSCGPIFYSQDRVGRNGKTFKLWKFRSMTHGASGPLQAEKNDPRVTRVGRFIRDHRIDELPQLINVMRGEMSLVGPRPQHPDLVRDLKQQLAFYDLRHTVRPGLTSWAHVCGGYAVSVEDHRERLSHDLYYIKNWCNSFDVQILLQTAKVVLFGRGSR